jgi:hypothetical protein
MAAIGALVVGAGLVACTAPKQPPPPPPTMVDDDGQADPGNCDGTGTAATAIQAVVTAAAPGTNIDVCPGTYAEQLTVPASLDNITLRSTQPRGATIKAPASMVEPGDIIRVDGASGLSIRGFVIAGPLPNALFCSTETRAGLFVANGGEVTVDDNQFTEIRAADPNLRGCQNGIALRVGRQASSSFGTATITNNDFDTYQKGAIVIDGSGSSADVTLNQVIGEGPVNYIAQNGIQVSRGATGNVAGNTVQDHTYAPAPASSSSGILIFEAGSGLVVNNNDVHDNDDNISLFTVSGVVVQQNAVQDATEFDGLFADSDTSGNQFIENFADDNQAFDCEDLSVAVAVPPVANTWSDNTGTTSNPPLLCTPPFPPPQEQSPQAQTEPAAHQVQPAG